MHAVSDGTMEAQRLRMLGCRVDVHERASSTSVELGSQSIVDAYAQTPSAVGSAAAVELAEYD
jgi:hypothetical protein